MCIRLYISKDDFESGFDLKEKSFVVPLHKAWCEDCQIKTEVEVMPSIEQIKNKIEEVKHKEFTKTTSTDYFDESKVYNTGFTQKEKEEELEFHSKFLEWRKKRVSPRKCLECGSEKVTTPKEELWDSLGVICNMTIYYDFEGNKLG